MFWFAKNWNKQSLIFITHLAGEISIHEMPWVRNDYIIPEYINMISTPIYHEFLNQNIATTKEKRHTEIEWNWNQCCNSNVI